MKQNLSRRNEKGSALVETIIGLLIFTVATVSAAQLLRVHINPLLMTERQRKADAQAASLINLLAANSTTGLTDGGSFTTDATGAPVRNADNTITLTCTNKYCDKVFGVPEDQATGLTLVRYDWTTTAPSNGQGIYTRAWSIKTIDAARQLRRITTAIFPYGTALPLSVQTMDVVQQR